ncbi:MAG: hypothetical protein ACYCYM_05055 [Saccharofermentanales bacterium]
MDQNTNFKPSSGGDSPSRQNSGPRPAGGGNYNPGRYNNRRRKPRPHNPNAGAQGTAQPGAQGQVQGQGAAQPSTPGGSQAGVARGVQAGVQTNARSGPQTARPQGNVQQPRPSNSDRPAQNPQQGQNRPADRTPRPAANTGNTVQNRPAAPQQAASPYRNDRPARNWQDHKVKIEETLDDVRRDNERLEKEIWLEIAEIHNMRID